MVRFFGKATGKVDDKGRLVFPSIFRDAMIRGCAEDMTLVVKKNVHQRCLDLFPYEEWVRRSDKVLDPPALPRRFFGRASALPANRPALASAHPPRPAGR